MAVAGGFAGVLGLGVRLRVWVILGAWACVCLAGLLGVLGWCFCGFAVSWFDCVGHDGVWV